MQAGEGYVDQGGGRGALDPSRVPLLSTVGFAVYGIVSCLAWKALASLFSAVNVANGNPGYVRWKRRHAARVT